MNLKLPTQTKNLSPKTSNLEKQEKGEQTKMATTPTDPRAAIDTCLLLFMII